MGADGLAGAGRAGEPVGGAAGRDTGDGAGDGAGVGVGVGVGAGAGVGAGVGLGAGAGLGVDPEGPPGREPRWPRFLLWSNVMAWGDVATTVSDELPGELAGSPPLQAVSDRNRAARAAARVMDMECLRQP
jgi:hypothetical protein